MVTTVQKSVAYKVFSVTAVLVMLAAVATSIACAMDLTYWINRTFLPASDNEQQLLTMQSDKYTYGSEAPLEFGAIANPHNAYFRVKLRFRSAGQGQADIIQTGSPETGLRAEISGATVTVIFPEKPSVASGLRRMALTTTLQPDVWHVLELEGMNGAFVRANLDGRPAMLYGGAEISIETSRFLLGGTEKNSFKGELSDLYLVRGNLPDPPRGAMQLVLALTCVLIVIFVLALYNALEARPVARKFVLKLSVLSLPLLAILCQFEYKLSFLNTVYFQKRIALEQQLGQVEVLVVGSSNTVFGVNPASFSRHGFNFAFPGQGMFYDAQLASKFSQRMPALRMVVLTVNFFTLGMDDAKFSQSWRAYFDRQFFDVSTSGAEGPFGKLKFWFEPRNFSKIALYGNEIKTQKIQDYKVPVDVIETGLGWFDAGTVPVDEALDLGRIAAEAHNVVTNTKNYAENLELWSELIPELRSRNIAVAIVQLPTDQSYYSHLDPGMVRTMRETVGDFAKRNGVRFVDYTGDSRFSSVDFSFELVDHLNAAGANKFSRILDQEVIQRALK